jgi:hypothetical protein
MNKLPRTERSIDKSGRSARRGRSEQRWKR